MYAQEIEQGKRFGFGENWANFLRTLNEERIDVAERMLGQMLDDLDPPSVVILADRASDRTMALDALTRVGMTAPFAQVLNPSDEIPEHAALLVLWGVPSTASTSW